MHFNLLLFRVINILFLPFCLQFSRFIDIESVSESESF